MASDGAFQQNYKGVTIMGFIRSGWKTEYPITQVPIGVVNYKHSSGITCTLSMFEGNCHTVHAYNFFDMEYPKRTKKQLEDFFLQLLVFCKKEGASELCFSFNGEKVYDKAKQVVQEMGFKLHEPKWNNRYDYEQYVLDWGKAHKYTKTHFITKVDGCVKTLHAKYFGE